MHECFPHGDNSSLSLPAITGIVTGDAPMRRSSPGYAFSPNQLNITCTVFIRHDLHQASGSQRKYNTDRGGRVSDKEW